MKQGAEDYNRRGEQAVANRNCVGTIWKPFGADGRLIVKMWEAFPQENKEPLWVVIDSLAVPLFIIERQSQGVTKCVVVFEDFETKERAEMLLGLQLFAEGVGEEDEAEERGSLVGYAFKDNASGRAGEVVGFVDSDLNPLLEVRMEDGAEVLVPLAEDLIEKLDEKRRKITMSLPEGLLDLWEE